jgi:hypothetical protein
MFPGLPSLDRVAWGDFPGFTGSMESSDISYPSQVPLVSLGARYLRWVIGFAPPVGSPDPRVALVHGRRWTGPIGIAGDRRFSQVSGDPLCMRAPLFDPGGSDRSRPMSIGPMLPSEFLTPSATTITVLSRLNHAAHMLAVYASRRGSPLRRARLAISWLARPSLSRTCTCWVPIPNFKAASEPPLPTSQT